MPQCCYLAKGAKRPSHTTNTIKFDRIQFDPCNSIKRFDLCRFDQKNSTYLQPPNWRQQKLSKKLKIEKKTSDFFFEISGKSHSAKKCRRGTLWDFLKIHSVAKYQKLIRGTKLEENQSHSAEKRRKIS